MNFFSKNACRIEMPCVIFAAANANAEVAQLVERNLAKVEVASSNLVFRSSSKP